MLYQQKLINAVKFPVQIVCPSNKFSANCILSLKILENAQIVYK